MFNTIKKLFLKIKGKENAAAKKEQIKNMAVIVGLCLFSYGFYAYNNRTVVDKSENTDEIVFDGTFDKKFQKDSEEALILRQQRQIEEIASLEKKNITEIKDKSEKTSATTNAMLKKLASEMENLKQENAQTKEQLKLAILQSAQVKSRAYTNRPPTREEMKQRLIDKQRKEQRFMQRAGVKTVRFRYKKNRQVQRTPNNYVWAGTFVNGIMLNGVKGDAGVNGPKNRGVVTIRLTSGGKMPNGKRSRLKDCFVLASSYGDLSGDSIVMHLQTLSCASSRINFEKKVYGTVFDTDAMQDLRGTSILNTKPLLNYTAAAGMLAGIGDGLKSIGSAQSIGTNGAITTFSATSLARNAAGGAMTNPANKISDYVMKIADLYHPLVIARGGRRVTVQFSKGFWIDRAHQKYESGYAVGVKEKNTNSVTSSVSGGFAEQSENTNVDNNNEFKSSLENLKNRQVYGAKQEFLSNKENAQQPLFTENKS